MEKDEGILDRMNDLKGNVKILIALDGEWVSARFDLTNVVVIIQADADNLNSEPREILLTGASSEELCGLIIKEGVTHVICGGIEDEHYQYLSWKGIAVFDRVIGRWQAALSRMLAGSLASGDVLLHETAKLAYKQKER